MSQGCAMSPTGVERRAKPRIGLIEEFITVTYNVLRKHHPELFEAPVEEAPRPALITVAELFEGLEAYETLSTTA